jgi:predicted nucleic acid-binding protein
VEIESEDVARAVTLVDANVLIDVATSDPAWSAWSEKALARAGDDGWLVINPIVYSELSVAYTLIEEVDAVAPHDIFKREPLPYEAAFLAGKAYLNYRRRGGVRRSPLPDFYIGAHAAVRGYRLLTRDAARYRTYFPTVDVIAPMA